MTDSKAKVDEVVEKVAPVKPQAQPVDDPHGPPPAPPPPPKG